VWSERREPTHISSFAFNAGGRRRLAWQMQIEFLMNRGLGFKLPGIVAILTVA
jgi:hypothetical protein